MDFLIGIATGMLLFWLIMRVIVWFTLRAWRRNGLERLLADIENHTEPQTTTDMVNLRLEQHQDIFLLFDVQTKKFVAQGRDHGEISRTLKSMFHDQPVVISEGEDDVIKRFQSTQTSWSNGSNTAVQQSVSQSIPGIGAGYLGLAASYLRGQHRVNIHGD